MFLFRVIIIFTLFTYTGIEALCQDTPFFVKGATWYYDAYTGVQNPDLDDPYGIIVLKYTRDTIVEGLKAVVIEESAYNALGIVEYSYRPPLNWIMRQEGLKILQYTDEGFQILYDFGAEKGDTIISSLSGIFGFEYNPEFMYVIDSISVFEYGSMNFSAYYFDSNIPPYKGRVRYLIGYDRFLPVPNPQASDLFYAPTNLRCYENDSLLIKFVDEPCDANLITSTKSPSQFDNWKIYPNPSSGEIRVTFPVNTSIEIKVIDLNGQIVLQQQRYYSENLIDIQSLSPGIYQIIADNKAADKLRFIIID